MNFWTLFEVSTFELAFKGLLVGILASAPMGPVGILCIQRTLQKGRSYGLVTGAGAALSDIIYALTNFKSIDLAYHVLKRRGDIPFVWHFKEGPSIAGRLACGTN